MTRKRQSDLCAPKDIGEITEFQPKKNSAKFMIKVKNNIILLGANKVLGRRPNRGHSFFPKTMELGGDLGIFHFSFQNRDDFCNPRQHVLIEISKEERQDLLPYT